MPKAMEKKLKAAAKKKFGSTTSERARSYIFGTMMKKTNWRPKRRKKGKTKK